MVQMKYKYNKLDLGSIKSLSPEDKELLLELIITDLNGKKVNGIENISEKNLTSLINYAIITPVQDKNMFWEKEQWFLIEEDYTKLQLKYTKEEILDMIDRFDKWKGAAKLSRTNIYLTISKWLKDNNKYALTQEQKDFIDKSYNAYINSTGVEGQANDILKYTEIITAYFKEGYSIEDIREYWKKVIPTEIGRTNDRKYRRKPITVIKEFKTYKKRGG